MAKKIIVIVAAVSLATATLAKDNANAVAKAVPLNAFNPGIYLGLQVGCAQSGWDRVEGNWNNFTTSNTNTFAWRIFAGYDFTKYLAAEIGYTNFGSNTKIKDPTGTVVSDISTQSFDLVGRIKAPLTDNFGVYGKVGVGYLMSKGLHKSVDEDEYYIGSKDDPKNVAAVFGVGVEYHFTPHVWMDLSWTKNIVGKNIAHTTDYYFALYQPDTDFYALGVAYKFNL